MIIDTQLLFKLVELWSDLEPIISNNFVLFNSAGAI